MNRRPIRRRARRRLVFLFLTNLILLTVASGLIPILPLRALALGATTGGAGAIMAAAYVAVLIGTLAGGRLASTHPARSRAIFHLAIAGSVAGFYLAGAAGTLSHYTAGILLAWFSGGFQVVMVSIYTGLNAGARSRGRIFALITTAGPLGAVLGGFASGRLVDAYGYQILFQVAAATQLLLLPLSAVALKRERASAVAPATTTRATRLLAPPLSPLPFSFWALLLATLLAAVAVVFGRLGTTLLMERLHFSATAISGVVAVGGLVTIPLLPLVGTLSDRNQQPFTSGRFLALSYLLAVAGLLLLREAAALAQFGLVTILLTLSHSLAGALASAQATALVPEVTLARALSLLNSTNWLAMIVGFAAGGYLLQHWSPAFLYLVTTLLPLLALLLLLLGNLAGASKSRWPMAGMLDVTADREGVADRYAAGRSR